MEKADEKTASWVRDHALISRSEASRALVCTLIAHGGRPRAPGRQRRRASWLRGRCGSVH
eukprot:6185215-Pleurochrysis_carterae.AAC.3